MKFSLKRRETADPTAGERKTTPPIVSFLFELIQVAAISLAIIIPVRYFLIQPFYVKGASMEPSFFDHEYLVIDELSYRISNPQRGDIVVFRYPLDPKQFFIKRVIGLPGETVEVNEDGIKIYNNEHPNGMLLDETYLGPGVQSSMTRRTITLKDDEYFVMGDNRGASLDSRYFGPIKRTDIVGRVWLRGWPFDRWTVFDRPNYIN
jgi:signal peptidase I